MRKISAVAIAFLLACSDDTTTSDAGADATASDASADSAPVDAGSDVHLSDAAEGGGPILDACVAIEGGHPCDPAHITCGTTSCTAGSQFCCIQNDAGTFTCDTMTTQCQTMMVSGTTMYCDEAANCPDAEVCCGFIGAGGGYATSCQAACAGNAIQFCHGSAECASGSCVGRTCNGVYVETCGALVECPP
jgi:hypothetical protein